jgi:hypothetical protein
LTLKYELGTGDLGKSIEDALTKYIHEPFRYKQKGATPNLHRIQHEQEKGKIDVVRSTFICMPCQIHHPYFLCSLLPYILNLVKVKLDKVGSSILVKISNSIVSNTYNIKYIL